MSLLCGKTAADHRLCKHISQTSKNDNILSESLEIIVLIKIH